MHCTEENYADSSMAKAVDNFVNAWMRSKEYSG